MSHAITTTTISVILLEVVCRLLCKKKTRRYRLVTQSAKNTDYGPDILKHEIPRFCMSTAKCEIKQKMKFIKFASLNKSQLLGSQKTNTKQFWKYIKSKSSRSINVGELNRLMPMEKKYGLRIMDYGLWIKPMNWLNSIVTFSLLR